ncbi:hypothetical protein H0H93_005622, partial [Arthromyces matolae]
PVQDFVEYEVVKFRSGLNGEGDDIYSSPPSDEVDAAWSDLYNGIHFITSPCQVALTELILLFISRGFRDQ